VLVCQKNGDTIPKEWYYTKSIGNYNFIYSYPERWRDWPDETRQPTFRYGAKSCRIYSWKMRGDRINEPSLNKRGLSL